MSEADSDLTVKQLTKEFSGAAGALQVLRGVDLTLRQGESVVVTGPSGSGKSTLLYVVGTLDRPTSGDIVINGKNPFAMDDSNLAKYRNETVGFIFQDHHLLPQCRVLENVLIPMLAGSGADAAAEQRARELLDRVGLGDRLTCLPSQISGGERQRVAVCRALINQPSLLLADEPTGNLDRETAELVGTLLLDLGKEQNTMLICVTHSSELAARFSRQLQLRDGTLAERT